MKNFNKWYILIGVALVAVLALFLGQCGKKDDPTIVTEVIKIPQQVEIEVTRIVKVEVEPTEQPTQEIHVYTAPTKAPTAVPSPTPIPWHPEFEFTNVENDPWNPNELQFTFTFPIAYSDTLQFTLIDEDNNEWPLNVSQNHSVTSDGFASRNGWSDCYLPWGEYTIQSHMEGNLIEYQYDFGAPIDATNSVVTTTLLDNSEPYFTKVENGWKMHGGGGVRDDEYLLEIAKTGISQWRVRVSNLNTNSNSTIYVNENELVEIFASWGYYDENGKAVDGAYGGFIIWPAKFSMVNNYGGAWSNTRGIAISLDSGVVKSGFSNLPRYFQSFKFSDTWITMEDVNITAYNWLLQNRSCPIDIEYNPSNFSSTETTSAPAPTVRPSSGAPIALANVPFERLTKLQAPASDFHADGTDLVLGDRFRGPLAGCNTDDPVAINNMLAGQGSNSIVVWVWDGYAHTFETPSGGLLWQACSDWTPSG